MRIDFDQLGFDSDGVGIITVQRHSLLGQAAVVHPAANVTVDSSSFVAVELARENALHPLAEELMAHSKSSATQQRKKMPCSNLLSSDMRSSFLWLVAPGRLLSSLGALLALDA